MGDELTHDEMITHALEEVREVKDWFSTNVDRSFSDIGRGELGEIQGRLDHAYTHLTNAVKTPAAATH
jgi:hypothetical protein